MQKIQPFHLAIPVNDIQETRVFYRDVLGCEEGRSSDHWVDFNFFGHQLVLHIAEKHAIENKNSVDGKHVPVPHFGVVLEWEQWHSLVKKLKQQNVTFEIEPYIRFEGLPGEQATLFFYDPSQNALEFKAFKHIEMLFEK